MNNPQFFILLSLVSLALAKIAGLIDPFGFILVYQIYAVIMLFCADKLINKLLPGTSMKSITALTIASIVVIDFIYFLKQII